MYQGGVGTPAGPFPTLADGVYAFIRVNGAAGPRIWIPEMQNLVFPQFFGLMCSTTTLGVAPPRGAVRVFPSDTADRCTTCRWVLGADRPAARCLPSPLLASEQAERRCSSRRGHHGFSRLIASAAPAAAELCRSAAEARAMDKDSQKLAIEALPRLEQMAHRDQCCCGRGLFSRRKGRCRGDSANAALDRRRVLHALGLLLYRACAAHLGNSH